MERYGPLLVLFAFAAVLGIVGLLLSRLERPVWRLRARGVFESAEMHDYKIRRRSGAMVHSTRIERRRRNVIRFSGGAALYDVEGFRTFPPPGTPIEVYCDGGRWRIVPPESLDS